MGPAEAVLQPESLHDQQSQRPLAADFLKQGLGFRTCAVCDSRGGGGGDVEATCILHYTSKPDFND